MSNIQPVDKTQQFEGSVTNAINYFEEGNPYQYIKIYSNRKKNIYHNPFLNNPTGFIILYPINTTLYFRGSVNNAVRYFNEGNPYQYVQVYDNETQKCYRNPFSNKPSEFIELIPIDKTQEFKGSENEAVLYFKNNPGHYEYIKVYDNETQKWYHNPYTNKPHSFIMIEPLDQSIRFNENLEEVKTYLIENRTYEYIKVYDNETQKWYHNPFSNNPSEFIILKPLDQTNVFKGSVSNAMRYFNEGNPYQYIKIYSDSHKEWYHNPFNNPYGVEKQFIKLEDEPKIIFIDVDQTLIKGHTIGLYDRQRHQIRDLIDENTLDHLKIILKHLQELDVLLFINSRGNYENINLLIQDLGLDTFFPPTHILSANMPDEIREYYNITDNYQIERHDWGRIKTEYMEKTIEKLHIKKENVYFLDDTKENINYAFSNGFVNSFQVMNENPDMDISLVNYLDRIYIELYRERQMGRGYIRKSKKTKNKKHKMTNKKNKNRKNKKKTRNNRL